MCAILSIAKFTFSFTELLAYSIRYIIGDRNNVLDNYIDDIMHADTIILPTADTHTCSTVFGTEGWAVWILAWVGKLSQCSINYRLMIFDWY